MSQMGEAQAPLRFSETTRLAGKVLLSISTDLHESIIQISIFFNCNTYIYIEIAITPPLNLPRSEELPGPRARTADIKCGKFSVQHELGPPL